MWFAKDELLVHKNGHSISENLTGTLVLWEKWTFTFLKNGQWTLDPPPFQGPYTIWLNLGGFQDWDMATVQGVQNVRVFFDPCKWRHISFSYQNMYQWCQIVIVRVLRVSSKYYQWPCPHWGFRIDYAPLLVRTACAHFTQNHFCQKRLWKWFWLVRLCRCCDACSVDGESNQNRLCSGPCMRM